MVYFLAMNKEVEDILLLMKHYLIELTAFLMRSCLSLLQQNDHVGEDRNAKDGRPAGVRRLRQEDTGQVR